MTVQVHVEDRGAAGEAAARLPHVVRRAVELGVRHPERPIPFGLQPVLQVDLRLTDDRDLRELNRAYRGIDAATDVLSFSQIEGPSEFVPAPAGSLTLGDIIISVETARRQADEHGQTLAGELELLAAHGALHLLGYDHATPPDDARMSALTRCALSSEPRQ